jgi:hypothetical protein
VPNDAFKIVKGEPRRYDDSATQSGRTLSRHFCGNCGSPLYAYDADRPRVHGLRVGCIEERAMLVPRTQKWCRSALPWTQSLGALQRREGE